MQPANEWSTVEESLGIMATGCDWHPEAWPSLNKPEHSCSAYLYLVIQRRVVDDVGHQDGQQLSHSIDVTGEGSVPRGSPLRPARLASGFYPMPGYIESTT